MSGVALELSIAGASSHTDASRPWLKSNSKPSWKQPRIVRDFKSSARQQKALTRLQQLPRLLAL